MRYLQVLPLTLTLVLFLVFPILLIGVVSFWDYNEFELLPDFVWTNYEELFTSSVTYTIYFATIKFAFLTWVFTFLIGFTVAYFLAFHVHDLKWQIVLFLLCTIPFHPLPQRRTIRTMKLLLVNPNTTASMTAKMRDAACAVASPDTEIIAATAEYGPESIEGYYDEVFSVPAMLDAVKAHPDAAGVVVGCFDDTGVDAARCVTAAPVIGICQAAMQVASIVSGSFTVVTTLGRSVPALEHLARRYGYADLCRRVRAPEIPVLALEDSASGARDQLRAEIARALDEDGCEAIVLGCAGMVDMARSLSEELAVPVVEGVTAAVKIVEGLAALGISTSKRGGYAPPRPKAYTGAFVRYGPPGGTG